MEKEELHKERKMKNKYSNLKQKGLKEKSKGITLIALVITIIVLLILAGVSIATLTGENGILTKANEAKTKTEIGTEKEQIAMAVAAETADKAGGILTKEGLQYQLEKLGADTTVVNEGEGFRVRFNNSKREYVLDKNGNIIQVYNEEESNLPETQKIGEWTKLNKVSKLGGYNSTAKVNAPKLGSELTAVTLTSDLNDYTKDGTWYDYKEQTGDTDGKTSKWANAVTTDSEGKITGYYVWIPRFAYKITSGYHQSTTGKIEIKFLKDATNEFADGTEEEVLTDPSKITYTDNKQNQWLVHPAFLSDASIGGGFGSKNGDSDGITGIWVAKFEISAYVGESETSTKQINSETSKQQIKLKVLPGVQSSSVENIGTMYTLAYNMNRSSDSHMLKNSEWGAVAYLAHSKYGRNGAEVEINDDTYSSQDSSNEQDAYTGGSNTTNGYLSNGDQSTTGNAYGIYDMNGGKREYVASYINNGNTNLEVNGKDMVGSDKGTSTKYKTVYKSDSADNSYNLAEDVKGDAIYETSLKDNGSTSWNSDYSSFPNNNTPFFRRGGSYTGNASAGLFYFSNYDGQGNNIASFRSCLIIG